MTRSISHLIPGAMLLALAAAWLYGAEPQRTFATPEEAVQALIDASAKNDTAALLAVLGPGGKDVAESGDAAEDKAYRAEFAAKAKDKMRVEQDPTNPTRATLSIGEQDWPFPIPLVRTGGKWRFDSAQGRFEILARRVGRNELSAVEVCRGYVEAQLSYAERDRDADGVLEYAQKIVSSPGKKDGLYWEGESEALVPKAFAAAAVNLGKSGKPQPYHGYFFHIIKEQGPDAPGGAFSYVVKGEMIGGFALVAWPAEYGVSGVRTFMISHKGIVYQKDLGRNTTALARQMTRFNPDKSWREAEKE